jgi:DNA-binding GntR family transcriptional regulator
MVGIPYQGGGIYPHKKFMSLGHLSINSDNLKTREEVVTDAIRQAILRGRFRPGDKLQQEDLADELGVSRSPVREALRTLAAEELVTSYPHRGVVVTERSGAELEELLLIRILLEGTAARRAAPYVDEARLARLDAIIREAQTSTDTEHVLGLNNIFHTTIYEAIAQPLMIDLIQKLRNKVAPYNRVYLDMPGQKERAWSDHRRIYDACAVRDGERAEAETKRHLEQVFQAITLVAKLSL